MDGNLANVLAWKTPLKSFLALVSLNISLWFVIGQRPLFVLSVGCISYYLNYLWKHRIRPEVLVDPPDHESWVTLSTYDFQHAGIQALKRAGCYYINLRDQSRVLWTLLSCLIWVLVGKLGSQVSLLTLVFMLSNALFLVGPILSLLPPDTVSVLFQSQHEDLIPEPVAAEIILSSAADVDRDDSLGPSGPESLTPFQPNMPDHDDSDEEFHFDTKHFESGSSTSSASTSFELINI